MHGALVLEFVTVIMSWLMVGMGSSAQAVLVLWMDGYLRISSLLLHTQTFLFLLLLRPFTTSLPVLFRHFTAYLVDYLQRSIVRSYLLSMERKVVEKVLDSHDHDIDDAIRSLQALCLVDPATAGNDSTAFLNENSEEGMVDLQLADEKENKSLGSEMGTPPPVDRSSWIDIFVEEMVKATDWHDLRYRASQILEAFENNVVANCKASLQPQESASSQEKLMSFMWQNQILKKAVKIQHARGVEYKEKLKEVPQLKQMISQYQEQVRKLELNNYAMMIRLQKANTSSPAPSHFNPDVF